MIGFTVKVKPETIKDLDDLIANFGEKKAEMLDRLAQVGVDYAAKEFPVAVYDGTNDVVVSSEKVDDNTAIVKAEGQATLFIEFGAGVHYNGRSNYGRKYGYGVGTYRWNSNGWRDWWLYSAENGKGTNGITPDKPEWKHLVMTHGNPAARIMYKTRFEIINAIQDIAKEVF